MNSVIRYTLFVYEMASLHSQRRLWGSLRGTHVTKRSILYFDRHCEAVLSQKQSFSVLPFLRGGAVG
jgi:hypothetical protein